MHPCMRQRQVDRVAHSIVDEAQHVRALQSTRTQIALHLLDALHSGIVSGVTC